MLSGPFDVKPNTSQPKASLIRFDPRPDRTVGESHHLLGVAIEKEKAENVDLGNRDADMADVGHDSIERSNLDGIRHHPVIAQLSVRKDRDLDAARMYRSRRAP
jgi:hypothetical protein